MNQSPEKIPEKTEFKKRTSLPAKLNEPMTQEEVKKEAEEITQLVKFANKKPFQLFSLLRRDEFYVVEVKILTMIR